MQTWFHKQVKHDGRLWDVTLDFSNQLAVVKVESGNFNNKRRFMGRTDARRFYNSRNWRDLTH